MNQILSTALSYYEAGFSLIPIPQGNDKRPAMSWKPYQDNLPTRKQVLGWWHEPTCGIAIICGKISLALEVIDFDDGEVYDQWAELVESLAPGLIARLPRVRTPRGGVHVYTRVEKAEGNHKLALAADGQTLVETRGEGGYVLAPGSPAACHPSGRLYELMPGPPIQETPPIAAEERQLLHDAARSFNLRVDPGLTWDTPPAAGESKRPGDIYNERASWEELLGAAGWTKVLERGPVGYWRRPGKKGRSWSATVGRCRSKADLPLLHVFTTSASPFRNEASYSLFAAYTLLHHSGDYKAAARALAGKGYAEQQQQPRRNGNGYHQEPLSEKGQKAVEVLAQLTRPDGAKVWQLDRLLDAEFPPQRWVVEGLVPDEGLAFLGGRKKLGKSWLCLQIAQGVASGTQVLKRPTTEGAVVLIMLEDGARRIRDRLLKQKAPRGLPITLYTQIPPLDGPEGMGELIEVLEKKPKLVILDTLAASKTGKTDENAAGPMADLANALRKLAQHYKTGILVTHHHGKMLGGDPGDDMRGSSALAAAGDVNLGLYHDEDRRARLKGEGRDIENFDLAIEFDPFTTWCWSALGDSRQVSRDEADNAILGVLRQLGQADAATIGEAIGKGKTAVAERLYRLCERGIVSSEFMAPTGGRPRTLYRLADAGPFSAPR